MILELDDWMVQMMSDLMSKGLTRDEVIVMNDGLTKDEKIVMLIGLMNE